MENPQDVTTDQLRRMFDIVVELKEMAYEQLSELHTSEMPITPVLQRVKDNLPDILSEDFISVAYSPSPENFPIHQQLTKASRSEHEKTKKGAIRRKETSQDDPMMKANSSRNSIMHQATATGREVVDELKKRIANQQDTQNSIRSKISASADARKVDNLKDAVVKEENEKDSGGRRCATEADDENSTTKAENSEDVPVKEANEKDIEKSRGAGAVGKEEDSVSTVKKDNK